jgi:hypothetical protein
MRSRAATAPKIFENKAAIAELDVGIDEKLLKERLLDSDSFRRSYPLRLRLLRKFVDVQTDAPLRPIPANQRASNDRRRTPWRHR